MEFIQEERREGEDLFGERGIAVVEDLPGGLVVFVTVLAEGVKPEQVGSGLGEEVGAGGEGFDLALVNNLVSEQVMIRIRSEPGR